MKQQSKLTARQEAEEQQLESQKKEAQQQPLEFATPEDLLRHDAMHTPVPPRVAERLQESVSQERPPGSKPWWRRIMGS